MCKKYFPAVLLLLLVVTSSSAQPDKIKPPEKIDGLPIGTRFPNKAESSPIDSSKIKFKSKCYYWWAKVIPTLRLPVTTDRDETDRDETDEQTVIGAIDCLLKLKGSKKQLGYTAVIDFKLIESQIPSPTIEIAALYWISALYYEKWNHASAIALLRDGKVKNQAKTVRAAYAAYEIWFKQVKEIGLKEARRRKLDPLANSGIVWFGNYIPNIPKN